MTGSHRSDAWRYDDHLGWLLEPRQVSETPISDRLALAPVAPRATNELGIDTASWQGQPNWTQVANTGRRFVYIKSSEGTDFVSPTLDGQYQGARAAGLTVGLYHFADPSQSPEANADFFATHVNHYQAIPGHLPPCLDLETGTGDLSNWASRFISRLRAQTGCVRVMIYSSASFFRNQIREDWADANVALWIASWQVTPGQPSYMSPRVAIHQYADDGVVSGINGKVDLDIAVWPLSTIVPGSTPTPPPATTNGDAQVSVLTPDEQSRLTATYQQLSGSLEPGKWDGWPTWPGGTNERLTLVDYSRRANQQLVSLQAGQAALKAELDTLRASTPTGGALSDNDVQRIAVAVANTLAQRMAA